jgi:hypothetical protein
MKINKEWHLSHKMPENATLEDRIKWHQAHALHCGCRDTPLSIKLEIKKRELKGAKRQEI